MKILDAVVIDPREDMRAYIDPWIALKVDEEVEETDDAKYQLGRHPNWRLVPCGPFFAVEYKTIANGWDNSVDIGRFNTLGFHREQLIAVKVEWKEDSDDLTIGVPRAKRLLRKFAPDWEIKVNETAAASGRVAWRVERIVPRCFGDCGVAPTVTVWYGGAHVNLCPTHQKQHNQFASDRRVSHI